MGKASREKGSRVERQIVHLLQEKGFAAERVPNSGSSGGRFGGDVSVPVLGDDWRLEIKARSHGFARLYDWLSGADALIVKADREEPLVVLPLRRAADILAAAEKRRTG